MGKKKILFVDDELDMRIYISAVLRSEGYDAVPARNAVEGMQKAREFAPDLVIMDVMMPQAGGVTLFQEIRHDDRLKHTPVIMLTGVSAKAFAHHLKMLSVIGDVPLAPPEAYLEKPLDPARLVQTIRGLLHEDVPSDAS
jgi:CheY-like chemotaxis protein